MAAKKRLAFFFKRTCRIVFLLLAIGIPAIGQGRWPLPPDDAYKEWPGLIDAIANVPFLKPTITASAQNICPGATVSFAALPLGANSYLWYINGVSTGVTASAFSYNAFKDQDQVTCYVTDGSGDAFSDPLIITVGDDQSPSVNISATSANICKGTPVTFTAVPVNGGTAPVFQWKVNGAIVGAGVTYTTAALQNSDAVTCVMTSNAKCVAPAPVASYAIYMNVSDITTPAGKILSSATQICAGTRVDFSMNMSVGEPVSYQWKINMVTVSTDASFSTVNLADQDMVSCDMKVNTLCSTGISFSPAAVKMSVTAYVYPAIVISSSAPGGVCPGTPLTFTAVPANAGSTAKYQWMVNHVNAGTNSAVFTSSALSNNDIITCKLTPQNVPCLAIASVLSAPVTVNIFPLPDIILPAVQKIAAGSSIVLLPVISGNISNYLWSPAGGLSSTTIKTPTASPEVNTTYTLTVVSTDGCTATGVTTVKLSGGKIIVKNTFTPNDDGVNDKWEIPNLINYDDCTVTVFNRYGTKVFFSVGYPNAWDGRSNNAPLPQGVYYYHIDLKDGSKPLAGSITIMR